MFTSLKWSTHLYMVYGPLTCIWYMVHSPLYGIWSTHLYVVYGPLTSIWYMVHSPLYGIWSTHLYVVYGPLTSKWYMVHSPVYGMVQSFQVIIKCLECDGHLFQLEWRTQTNHLSLYRYNGVYQLGTPTYDATQIYCPCLIQ